MESGLLNAVRAFVALQRSVPLDAVHARTTLLGDLGLDGDDAREFFSDFAREFQVDMELYEHHRFFGSEGFPLLTPLYWLRSLWSRGTPEERAGLEPVTVADLAQAAAEHRWPKSSTR